MYVYSWISQESSLLTKEVLRKKKNNFFQQKIESLDRCCVFNVNQNTHSRCTNRYTDSCMQHLQGKSFRSFKGALHFYTFKKSVKFLYFNNDSTDMTFASGLLLSSKIPVGIISILIYIYYSSFCCSFVASVIYIFFFLT